MDSITIHVSAIGPEKTSGILYFHAFTGCNVVSAFHGKGKKSAWHTWNVCNDASTVFKKLASIHHRLEMRTLSTWRNL